jgi:hypothetical protein
VVTGCSRLSVGTWPSDRGASRGPFVGMHEPAAKKEAGSGRAVLAGVLVFLLAVAASLVAICRWCDSQHPQGELSAGVEWSDGPNAITHEADSHGAFELKIPDEEAEFPTAAFGDGFVDGADSKTPARRELTFKMPSEKTLNKGLRPKSGGGGGGGGGGNNGDDRVDPGRRVVKLGFANGGAYGVLGRGWNPSAFSSNGKERVVPVNNNSRLRRSLAQRSSQLLVTYPSGSYGYPGRGGIQFDSRPLPRSKNIKLTYFVFVPRSFNFVKGGKLPGAFGGQSLSGGVHTGEGVSGMSLRLHWRANGMVHPYGYIPTTPGLCGRGDVTCNPVYGISLLEGYLFLKRGQWNKLSLTATMNDIGRANGSVVLEVNGARRSAPGLILRTSKSLGFDGIYFSSFFGGSDRSWATPSNQQLGFKDFTVQMW